MATGYSSIPSFGLTENKKDLQFKTLENLHETNEIITEDISQRIFNNDGVMSITVTGFGYAVGGRSDVDIVLAVI